MVVLSACLLLTSLRAFGYDFESGGIYYNINPDGVSVSVTYQMVEYDIEGFPSYSSDYQGDVAIPATVNYRGKTYTVVSIGKYAFSNSFVSNVSIPPTVTSIGIDAFWNCRRLYSVSIPNSVTEIENGAFYSCTVLRNITLPEGLTTIRKSVFENCGLTCIEFPRSVTTIQTAAFFGSGLTSIYIPSTITEIESMAFSFCTDLAYISVSEDNPVYDSRDDCNALIESASNNLLTACNNTVIPGSVTSIEPHAFDCCGRITRVVIPASVTSIGSWTFTYCSNLNEVVCESTTPPQMSRYSFTNYSPKSLYVPRIAVETYRHTDYWNLFGQINGFSTAGPNDVNGDNRVDIADVTELIDILLGVGDNSYADVNGDGQVTISDVTTLIDILLSGNTGS